MSAIKLASGGLLHPDYLAHAKKSFLAESEVDAFIASCGKPLRQSIRVNTLKISRQDFLQIAADYNWQLIGIPWCKDGFWIDAESTEQTLALGNTPEHIQGLFYIQEASSMLPPVALLQDLNHEDHNHQVLKTDEQYTQLKLLDMAAAPGSKTTQLAAMINNKGLILANELSASRLKYLAANLSRCGVLNTAMSHHDAVKLGQWLPQQFDYVLLDAPCGGEGTVRKDIHALKNWSLDSVHQLAQLQKRLILSAYQALKPDGKMVYSTCTLSSEENQQVVDYLIEQTDAEIQPLDQLFAGAELAVTKQGSLLVLPQQFDSEGFFIACLKKPKSSEQSKQLSPIYSSPFIAASKKEQQQILQYYSQHFGFKLDLIDYEILKRDKEFWLFPCAILTLNQFIKINRAGIRLGQIFPNKIRSHHDFVCSFGQAATQQRADLNLTQLAAFYRGENLNLNDSHHSLSQGEVFLCFQKQVIGVGQNQKGKIKNLLPRDLVKDNINFD
jgi:16S rRNA (cytosine1407-C5)-methyltransferase